MRYDDIRQCATCAVEYDAAALPQVCPICADERQYVAPEGQRWLTPGAEPVGIELVEREPGLWGLRVDAAIGIGQEAKVVVTDAGCVMFDVPAAITADAVRAVRRLGPMRAIVPSHPHMFGLQSVWSRELDDAPVFVAAADERWLGRRPAACQTWTDSVELRPGVTISQPGGHFPGSAVLHWAGADGRGVLLSGDTIMVNPDRSTVSFMRSYPNRIPLSPGVVRRVAAHVDEYEFDRIYNNFDLRIETGAREAVRFSARRHCAWVEGEYDHLT